MQKLLVIVAGLLAAVVIGLIATIKLFPKDVLEARIEGAATKALGREVQIGGAPAITIFPTRVVVRDLVVANADGFDAPHLVAVGEAEIGVKLLPMLRQRVEITTFRLTEPDIRLETRADGATNWGLAPAPETEEPTGPATLPDIRLGDLIIEDGSVTFDDGSGNPWIARDADLVLSLPSLDDPLTLTGTMMLREQPTTVDAFLDAPRTLIENNTATIRLSTKVADNTATTTLSLGDGLTFTGEMDIDFPALRQLIAFAGADLPSPNGFERLKLKGNVAGNAERFAFAEGTELRFDDIVGEGQLTIDLSGEIPRVTGAVAVGALDLTPYLPPTASPSQTQEDFPAWSDDPIDVSALRTVDADLRFAADRLTIPPVTIGQSAVHLVVSAGVATATLENMSLYGGTGQGVATLNAARSTPRVDLEFELTGVEIGDLAEDVAGIDRLRGVGDVSLDIAASGASQQAMVQTLAGSVGTTLANGSLRGVNLGKVARGIGEITAELRSGDINPASLVSLGQRLSANANGPAEQTDFASLRADTRIARGVVTVQSLRLEGAQFAMSGAGRINLPGQAVDLTFTPSAVIGGKLQTLAAPVFVRGTFNTPQFGLDTAPLVKSAATDAVTDLLEKRGINVPDGGTVKGALQTKASEELRNLITGDEDSDASGEKDAAETLKDAAINRGLNSLFGKSKETGKEGEAPAGDETADTP